jgi:hypothetical protein
MKLKPDIGITRNWPIWHIRIMQGYSKVLSEFPLIGYRNPDINLESHYMNNQSSFELSPYGFLLSARSANYRKLCWPFPRISLSSLSLPQRSLMIGWYLSIWVIFCITVFGIDAGFGWTGLFFIPCSVLVLGLHISTIGTCNGFFTCK